MSLESVKEFCALVASAPWCGCDDGFLLCHPPTCRHPEGQKQRGIAADPDPTLISQLIETGRAEVER